MSLKFIGSQPIHSNIYKLELQSSKEYAVRSYEGADLLEELDFLRNVFIRNGYPEKWVVKTLQEEWPRETLKVLLMGRSRMLKWKRKESILTC